MKRDARLAGLSREHHRALVLARRCVRAAGEEGLDLARAWRDVKEAFAGELAPHFAIEERTLFEALSRAGQVALVERARREHERLRELTRGDGRDDLAAFGELLASHVRFEERELFPCAEANLSDGALAEVAAACARHAEPD